MNPPDVSHTKSRKPGKPLVLYALSSVYLLLYVMFIIDEEIAFNFSDTESTSAFLLFLFYLSVFILSWFKERIAGYLFVLWYVIMITLADYVWTGAGMTIILGFPALPIGVFYVLYDYKKSLGSPPESHQLWQLALRILILAYAAIYLILIPGVYPDLAQDGPAGAPVLYLELLLLLFAAGVLFAFRNELIAGILFISWYVGILVIVKLFPELTQYGPYRFIGSVILLHGIFYLVYRFLLKPRRME